MALLVIASLAVCLAWWVIAEGGGDEPGVKWPDGSWSWQGYVKGMGGDGANLAKFDTV